MKIINIIYNTRTEKERTREREGDNAGGNIFQITYIRKMLKHIYI